MFLGTSRISLNSVLVFLPLQGPWSLTLCKGCTEMLFPWVENSSSSPQTKLWMSFCAQDLLSLCQQNGIVQFRAGDGTPHGNPLRIPFKASMRKWQKARQTQEHGLWFPWVLEKGLGGVLKHLMAVQSCQRSWDLQSTVHNWSWSSPPTSVTRRQTKQKGQGKGWGINLNFKQYLLKKRTCWWFVLNILMCYGAVLCQQKQSASSRLFTQPQHSWKANSSQETVQHKHWLQHTRSPLPWHCHWLSQEQEHRAAQASTAQFQHSAAALPTAANNWEVRSRTEASPTRSYHSGMAKSP